MGCGKPSLAITSMYSYTTWPMIPHKIVTLAKPHRESRDRPPDYPLTYSLLYVCMSNGVRCLPGLTSVLHDISFKGPVHRPSLSNSRAWSLASYFCYLPGSLLYLFEGQDFLHHFVEDPERLFVENYRHFLLVYR